MGWDPVPWMVGGGAEHSTNVARNVSHAAFGGREGIVSPTDCEVRELAAPGSSVRVFPGTVAIKNRATGTRDEMYVGRLPTEDQVAIAATDSTGGRSDLIIARVENPFQPGEPWSDPADPKTGPYIFTRIISNVPAGTKDLASLNLGYSAIALARIDLPASTATITQSMITDLRTLNRKQTDGDSAVIAPTKKLTLTSSAFVNWPDEALLTLTVPEWATHCKALAIIGGVSVGGDSNTTAYNIYGQVRLAFTAASGTTYGQSTAYNFSNAGGHDRTMFMAGSNKHSIATSDRGKSMTVRVQGLKSNGNGEAFSDTATMVSLQVEFMNMAESNV